jgi:hypothetical protein
MPPKENLLLVLLTYSDILYAKDARPLIKAEPGMEELGPKEMVTEIGRRWKLLPEDLRKVWCFRREMKEM